MGRMSRNPSWKRNWLEMASSTWSSTVSSKSGSKAMYSLPYLNKYNSKSNQGTGSRYMYIYFLGGNPLPNNKHSAETGCFCHPERGLNEKIKHDVGLEISPVEATKTAGWKWQTEEVVQLKITQPSRTLERRKPSRVISTTRVTTGEDGQTGKRYKSCCRVESRKRTTTVDTQRQCTVPHRITHANQRLRRFLY